MQYAIENQIDLILVQEPWITIIQGEDYLNSRLVNHQSFIQLKATTKLRPRTMVYITRNSKFNINILNISPNNPDLLIVNITSGHFNCQLVNIYNKLD